MEQRFIMTAFGKDRPGIVADISEMVFENHCNLEDSNMGRLADEFTLILLLTGQGEDLEERLSRDCRRLEREKGLSAFVRPLDHNGLPRTHQQAVKTICVEGVDQGGIVYRISRLLSRHKVNIETLTSKKKYSPGSGTAMYAMEIRAALPDALSSHALAEALDDLGCDLNVDITLMPEG